MAEIVYIFIFEYMPGLVKIGKTNISIETRLKDLYTSAVPVQPVCYYAAIVDNAARREKQLHKTLDQYRVNKRREFFEVDPEFAASYLRMAEIEDITPKDDIVVTQEDQQALEEARKKRSNFSFNAVGIKPGSELTFVKNHNIKAKVIGNKTIEYNGEETSLSISASRILNKKWVTGPRQWMYEGEVLNDRRNRLENEQ